MTLEKTAAVLTIHNASEMSVQGRSDIATWLRRQANDLVKLGPQYSKRLTARYKYTEVARQTDRGFGQRTPVLIPSRADVLTPEAADTRPNAGDGTGNITHKRIKR